MAALLCLTHDGDPTTLSGPQVLLALHRSLPDSNSAQDLSLLQVSLDDYTCEAQIVIPLDTPTLLMQEIAERVAVNTMVQDTPGECRLSSCNNVM